jgi:DNA topoisomerase-1
MSSTSPANATADCREAAAFAGLTYASADDPGIRRRKSGAGFVYIDAAGSRIDDAATLARIRALVIPPAWTSIWICPRARGHIQAVGRDQKGRRQYLYHARFRESREEAKFEHMLAFAKALPRLRRRVAADLAASGLCRRRVLATVVDLLETTMIRVGNAAYAKDNGSYGLTTLRSRHVKVEGARLRFHFKGKSGKIWELSLNDRRVARTVRSCQELPGQHLFQYFDDVGERQAVTSDDVNAYLRESSGADITAKDFRTWAASVLAATALAELEAPANISVARKNITCAIAYVAARLGNTPTICRKCYVHPEIVSAYLASDLWLRIGRSSRAAGLYPEEAAVLTFLKTRTSAQRRRAA